MENKHIVYIGRLHGMVVYIGEGVENRHLHLNSGVSHVYEANKSHFAGEVLDIEIFTEGLLKSEAREIEKQLIEKYKPAWNKTHTQKNLYRACIRKHLTDAKNLSTKLKLLDIAKDTITDSGEFIVTRKQIREYGMKEYPSRFARSISNDPMLEIFELTSSGAFTVKIRESWLAKFDINIREMVRKANHRSST